MKINEFEKRLYKKALACVKKYEIRYNPDTPVVSDDGMISRLFEAGLELYRDLGTYCINTERVIRFDESEIREELRELSLVSPEILIGEGAESRILRKRIPGENIPPSVIAGFIEDNPNEGRDYVQMYKSVAQEGILDGFYFGPAPRSIEGRPYVLNSPYDIHAAKSAIWWVREALRASGRPGLHLLVYFTH